MKRATILLALLSIITVTARAQRRDDPYADSQIWPDTQISFKLRPDLSLIFLGTVRLGRNDSAFVSRQVGVGLNKSFGRHFSSAFYYRYVDAEPTPERQSTEHRLFVDLTPRTSLKWGFGISDRNRIERRDINSDISWRYRNRLQFEKPVSVSERKIVPYIAGETMYDTRYRTWNRSGFYLGARVPLNKHIIFDGFYMRQWDAKTKPGFLHVIGAFWRFEF